MTDEGYASNIKLSGRAAARKLLREHPTATAADALDHMLMLAGKLTGVERRDFESGFTSTWMEITRDRV